MCHHDIIARFNLQIISIQTDKHMTTIIFEVLDNLILVHYQSSKSTLIFDLALAGLAGEGGDFQVHEPALPPIPIQVGVLPQKLHLIFVLFRISLIDLGHAEVRSLQRNV